jgi:outer membrane protein OmpA-like peptidoglycan-associated protein
VTIQGLDPTPLQAVQDSPVFTRGTNFEYQVRAAKLQPPQQVEQSYLQYLAIKSKLGSGILSYESGDYQAAEQLFREALQGKEETLLEALALNFAVYVKFGRYQQAEDLFARLLRRAVDETNACNIKFVFAVNAPQPIASPTLTELYNIYIRQLSAYVDESAQCQIRILGHSSRSGSETYNDELSLQRAQWLQQALLQQRPAVTNKIAAQGRGFRDNVVGTGADDITDQIDRRVEFQFLGCK